MAGMAMLALLIVVVWVPKSPSSEDDSETDGDIASTRASLSAVVEDAEMRGLLSYIGARGFYRWGFNSFFPVFAVSVAALSRTQVGLVLSVYMGVSAILQYPLGRLTDTYDEYRVAFVGSGGTLAALTMLAVPSMHDLTSLIVLLIAMGSFSALARAATVAIRTERGRVHGMGVVTGAYMTSLSAGQVFGPLVFGAVVAVFDIRDAFYLGGIVGLVGTAGAYWFLRRESIGNAEESVSIGND